MNKKKSILITSTDVMMIQFLIPHVNYLNSIGFQVDVACASAELYEKEGYFLKIKELIQGDSRVFNIRTKRDPFNIENVDGLNDLKEIINKKHYDLIWTNEPVMGVMTRLAAKKARRNGTRVVYMVHGYHFFKGAPKKNWSYYPVEKLMSHFCDAIVVINWEDYYLTKEKFHVPVYHINGIGVDCSRFSGISVNKFEKRKELGISVDDIVVISVGEMQSRKNQEVIIRAIARLNNNKIKYILCGTGELKEEYIHLSIELGIKKQVHFLGHRYDIPELLAISDIFVHPSQREGFGIAVIEAMSIGLPLVTSNVQGIKDYMVNGVNGYMCDPYDIDAFAKAIKKLSSNTNIRNKMFKINVEKGKLYSIENSVLEVSEIIKLVLKTHPKERNTRSKLGQICNKRQR